jgi:hypothetical protein
MTIGSILLGIALFLLVGLFVARPLMQRQTAILKQLDELDAVAEAAESSGPIQEADEQPNAIDADIEAAISRLRRESAAGVPIATRGSNGETRYCPQCGQPADAGDKFCAHCGHRLLQPQQA